MANPDLSILIPARNEMWLAKTIESLLANIRGNTEIIAVLDGAWANPPIQDHPQVRLIYHPISIGQRAATNEAARASTAKFVMKLDAHCTVDEGFDVKLMEDCEYNWVINPRMYNLHVFDWVCQACENRIYQGPKPNKCSRCEENKGFEMDVVWRPRWNRKSDFMRFDNTLHFQYWGALGKREGYEGDLAETMSLLGAAWFLHREFYWELGGMDEGHGSWGQMGTEISCKVWLSGGRLITNRKTWFSHLFRTQPGFGFPYPAPGVDKARTYSKWLWLESNWPKARHGLSWLLEKFWPVPDWSEEDLANQKERERGRFDRVLHR